MNNSNITADHNTKNTITEKQLRATASVARPVPRTYGSQKHRMLSGGFPGCGFHTFEATDVHNLLQSSPNTWYSRDNRRAQTSAELF